MCKRLVCLVSLALVLGIACDTWALVVSGFREWNQRIQLNSIGGLEITSAGHARFTARVDHDATDVIIHPGGILETLDTYKLPDGRPQPQRSNVYVYGTWNARDIQSFGVERAAYIYMGPEGEINITSNTDSGASYNPQAWLDEAQLGGRSLLLAPELDPAVWSIQIEDLGGGAYRITAVGPPPGGAAMPVPSDEATDVPRDVVLSWTPGPYARHHDVYFGANFGDVNLASATAAPAGVYRGRIDPNLYTPERLAFGQTYYWRVDEVNAPPGSTVFRGDVWSFRTEPVVYPIDGANITATASSSMSDSSGPQKTIDGSGLNASDLHSTNVDDMWLSNFSGPQPTWIQFEFDRVHKLREMWVWNQNQQIENAIGYGFKDVSVEYSDDGISYTPLGAGTEFARAPGAPGYAHNTTVDFGGVTAKYVRLTPNSNWGGFVPQYGLSEVRFLYMPVVARDPKPGSGTQDVSVDATLSWRAGREAARHNVYVSTDQQAVIDGTAPVTTVTVPSYISSLDLASTYYWRVDEVNDIETPTTWQGNVWSLSTQEYLVVDDFESYNEIAVGQPGSNLVYTTWLDGYGTTTNGSTMGYPTGNSLETTTVHGGTKAVPLIYNNSTASFSEVERTFAPQNWTSHGIQTLSVWFRGDATNVPGQLYVKINGIKSLYDGDAANLKREAWQTWNIDLASVGAPLQNVTRLAIGIDTKGATGTLLLDDIRLYPNTRELITPVQPNAAGLIGHWRFDGNTQDASGLGNHGTAGGGTTFGAGIVGSGAINLSGSGYVVIDGVANDITSTNITLAAWIKTTQTTEGNVFSCNDSATGHPLILGVTNGNLWFEDNASTQFAAVNDDQWHLIAYVRNGATGYIYLDGIQIGTEPANFSFGSVTRWSIGQEWDNSTPSDFYTGLVDDARIYNYPLSEAEIAGLAGMTLPFDKPF